ncbi:hypothetical protein [Marispirochaeta aestuarii]|uniref:hypothetical protein n=1 Tax=Marispirochaeta aestuarii TaxID=1963862 RepID=UPI002ABDEEFB|nr:hypothetical protein [Marispirochaeta aestuarii]
MKKDLPFREKPLGNSQSGIAGVTRYCTQRVLPSGTITYQKAWEATYTLKRHNKKIFCRTRFYFGRDRSEEEARDLAIGLRKTYENAFKEGGFRAAGKAVRQYKNAHKEEGSRRG